METLTLVRLAEAYAEHLQLTLSTVSTYARSDGKFFGRLKAGGQPAVIANGTYTIEGVEQALTPASGIAFYPWSAGDTAQQRDSCIALFHINWPGNLPETLPSDGYERFKIGDNF